MRRIEQGVPMTVIVGVLRSKLQMRTLVGSVAAIACSVCSPFYLDSTMGFLPTHMYNGEREDSENRICHITYSVLLLVVWTAETFLFRMQYGNTSD